MPGATTYQVQLEQSGGGLLGNTFMNPISPRELMRPRSRGWVCADEDCFALVATASGRESFYDDVDVAKSLTRKTSNC